MVMEAELRWTLHSVEKSKSFAGEDSAGQLFKLMFPDSGIANEFTCARTKQTYLLHFALSPYFANKMQNELEDRYYSISFDEADGRLAIVVRYVCGDGHVRVELLDLVTLQAFDSKTVVDAVLEAVKGAGLLLKRWISDETDKCNAMRGKH